MSILEHFQHGIRCGMIFRQRGVFQRDRNKTVSGKAEIIMRGFAEMLFRELFEIVEMIFVLVERVVHRSVFIIVKIVGTGEKNGSARF